MPWPTDPASEFFGRGLWGWATDVWERITSNGSGSLNVHIKSQTGTQLIQQVMPTLLKPGIHGYDGATWRKLALLFGYTDQVAEIKSNLSASVGTNTLTTGAVPAGEVWVVTCLSAFDSNSALTALSIGASIGGGTLYVKSEKTLAASEIILWDGQLYLEVGDSVFASFYGCTLNDDLYFSANGYKMAVE